MAFRRLTLSSSTLVAETGHQGGEEVRDGSDRVENLSRINFMFGYTLK
jgi:hypothetical protein